MQVKQIVCACVNVSGQSWLFSVCYVLTVQVDCHMLLLDLRALLGIHKAGGPAAWGQKYV